MPIVEAIDTIFLTIYTIVQAIYSILNKQLLAVQVIDYAVLQSLPVVDKIDAVVFRQLLAINTIDAVVLKPLLVLGHPLSTVGPNLTHVCKHILALLFNGNNLFWRKISLQTSAPPVRIDLNVKNCQAT